MKQKTILMTMLVCTFLNACAYKPIVDHRGNKGKDVAYRYNDDLETCKAIAYDNSNILNKINTKVFNYYIRPSLLWLPDEKKDKEQSIIRKCLESRGHSVLN
jgi:hypothetical protein|tara:strand:+ start:150 stop:455 length:306 start_codon:yes stop_codon:yes gene_type:complete